MTDQALPADVRANTARTRAERLANIGAWAGAAAAELRRLADGEPTMRAAGLRAAADSIEREARLALRLAGRG